MVSPCLTFSVKSTKCAHLCIQIWDLFEGRHLFYGDDPRGEGYMTRAHLAEIIAMIGPPPLDLVQKGARSSEFFTQNGRMICTVISRVIANKTCAGQWNAGIPVPEGRSLEGAEDYLTGESKTKFLNFVRGMLQWRPDDRKTAKQLLEDPWFRS